MGQSHKPLPKANVATQALRHYFGPHSGVVRAEMKAPDVFPLEESIEDYIPSALDSVIETDKLFRQAAETVKLFKELSEQAADVFPVFQTSQLMRKRLKALKEAIDFEFKSAFERLTELDLGEITDSARAAGRELGRRGWIVGPFMTHQGLFRVLKNDTDRAMKERYPTDSLVAMVEEASDSQWQEAILEAIDTYQDGRHRVVILSLLPAIEALVRERIRHRVDMDGVGRISILNLKASRETETLSEEKFLLLAASEASIVGFVNLRWDGGKGPDILQGDPSELNYIDRNWALHGADDPGRWDSIDAHRLMQVAAVLAHEVSYRTTPEEA